eukprot:CAMPEP_0183706102 /NCGR_PEP_ID=MMETSP0737-20130205/3009_1 /TAXON_ID=385413 /ORGANISM="Thalassiosira miniscula, Strain CCMP1093" /LENGTH=703 /DNA_ID=CAMNT_0025933413 /DNA_START=90 /DNA_END=2201 /DNA_ORIENTATION=-
MKPKESLTRPHSRSPSPTVMPLGQSDNNDDDDMGALLSEEDEINLALNNLTQAAKKHGAEQLDSTIVGDTTATAATTSLSAASQGGTNPSMDGSPGAIDDPNVDEAVALSIAQAKIDTGAKAEKKVEVPPQSVRVEAMDQADIKKLNLGAQNEDNNNRNVELTVETTGAGTEEVEGNIDSEEGTQEAGQENSGPDPALPGAYSVFPLHSNQGQGSDTLPSPSAPPSTINTSDYDASTIAEIMGIPMVEARAVNPENDGGPNEEGGPDSNLVPVSHPSLPPSNNWGEANSPNGREEGGEGRNSPNVVQAKSIPTITIFGRSVQRSTAGFVVMLVSLVAIVIAIAVPLGIRSNAPATDSEIGEVPENKTAGPWGQRRQVLVDILSPAVSEEGSFDEINGDGPRVEALEWLVEDFPENVTTLTEMLDHYPEWKMRQRYILALLYFSTNGTGWYSKLNFLSESDECFWAGSIPRLNGDKMPVYDAKGAPLDPSVRSELNIRAGLLCNGDGRVDSITLGVNSLVGTIPHEMSSLGDSLTKIGMMRNSLSSTIPSSLGELRNLKILNLMENCLTGVIPDLSNLNVLEDAKFRGNNDLRGNLNAFCNGTEYRENAFGQTRSIQADCGGCQGSTALVECTCCVCCDYSTMSCCDKEGKVLQKKMYTWETFNRGECSLNDAQREWQEENCPCYVEIRKGNANKYDCSTDCPA